MVALQKVFTSEMPEETLRARAVEFYQKNNYHPVEGSPQKVFKRGSRFYTWLRNNPRNWPVQVKLQIGRTPEWVTEVKAVYQLDTSGHSMITPGEQAYWQAELDAFEKALLSGQIQSAELVALDRAGQQQNAMIGLLSLLGVAIGMIGSLLLFRDPKAIWFGLLIGFGLSMLFIQLYLRRKKAAARISPAVAEAFPQMGAAVAADPDAPVDLSAVMRRDIRSWAVWLIITGVISMISGGFLSSPWGVMLILVGLGSYVFNTPAMYIIYGSTLLWATLNNATAGQTSWIVFALLQLFLSVRIFMQFARFNKAYLNGHFAQKAPKPEDLPQDPAAIYERMVAPASPKINGPVIPPDPNAPLLSWVSLGLGVLSITGLLALLVVEVATSQSAQYAQIASTVSFLLELVVDFGLVGFAAGLGSLLSMHRFKGAAITGLVTGGLTLGIMLIFIALSF